MGNKITTVNLLIDGTRFKEVTKLTEIFVANGIKRENIKVLVFVGYKIFLKKYHLAYFRPKDISSSGEIIKGDVKSFTEKSDLLVGYYSNNIKLDYITMKSDADFKVGFPMSAKQLNHITIDCSPSDYKLFTKELFKYLKVFNKI